MLQQIAPWFGYLASILLAIGLLVSNNLKFRWLNTGGNVSFIAYGVLLHAMPVVITNSILLAINLYYLYKIYNRKELFELIEFKPGDRLIERFLSFYGRDISSYFPGFDRRQLDGNLNFIVLRDLAIANIFSVSVSENGDAEVLINYTVPQYRDYKVGRFIFDKEKQYLLSKGVKKIVYTTVANRSHEKFLERMGFSNVSRHGSRYIIKAIDQ